MFNALIRLGLYVGIVLAPVTIAAVIGVESGSMIHEMGKNAALVAFVIIFLQVFLVARIKWIERPFGLDMVIRFHRNMAVLAAALLLSHPLLMAAAWGDWGLLNPMGLSWVVWLGQIALVLLIINIGLSVYQKKLKLKFELWRLGHNISGLLILGLIFTHSWIIGHDLEMRAMRAIWIIILSATVLMYLYHRLFRPWQRKRRAYEVVDVQQESSDVWTIKLAPPAGETIAPYLPGQFHFLTFYRAKDLPVEEHHWTISSSPAERGYVSSTIKELGDFTATISRTRKGDRASVHGAFGRFSYVLHPKENDLVFIAGGIGITPLMSMLRHMRDTAEKRSVLLFYANPEAGKIVFRQELEEMEDGRYPALKVVHVLDRPDNDWTGETGRVDREKIRRFCGQGNDLKEKVFYICGPEKMRDSVIRDLTSLGVPDNRMRTEIFSFLD
jgi:predicted ferric reductase